MATTILQTSDQRSGAASADGQPARDPATARGVISDALRAIAAGDATGVLAVVLDADGSTYAGAGGLALFAQAGQSGWLSGGCLEPAIAAAASECARDGRIGWMEIDTRDDAALFSGAALGCRGRLRIALLPLAPQPALGGVLRAWLAGGVALRLRIGSASLEGIVAAADPAVEQPDGVRARRVEASRPPAVQWHAGSASASATLPADAMPWPAPRDGWSLHWPAPPEVAVFGGGPESPVLLPLLRALGWRTTLVERRDRWRGFGALADVHRDDTPARVLADGLRCEAALVMHHAFEDDLGALLALAAHEVGFIGLLGPGRRRDDLFSLLDPTARAALQPRLRSPVGLRLGGQGPQAIALSIAAQLQAWRSGE